MTKRLIGILLLALLLVACGTEPLASSTAQRAATPTLLPTSVAATATAAAVRGTPVPNPTRTPVPEGEVIESMTARSPSGRWLARAEYTAPFTRDEGELYQLRVEVAQTKGGTRWLPLDEIRPFGLGYTVPEIVGWSADEQFLYFAEREVPDGCALFDFWTGLYGVDLASGQVSRISERGGTLSPDGRWLATADTAGREVAVGLNLLDLETGESRRIPFATMVAPSFQAGDVTWAPDGSAVLVVVAHAPCETPGWSHSIVRVEPASGTVTELVRADERLFRIASWDADQVILTDREGNEWLLDPASGETSER